ncbi:MAG: hypothetical protein RL685_1263 [Pseudomonadota bacterium]|jgi:hypothetical protein
MFKHLSVLPVLALLAINTACGDEVTKNTDSLSTTESSDSKTDKDPESGGSSSSSTVTTPKGDFELKLDSLVSQNAPWGDIGVNVEKARLLRGEKPAGFPTKEKHSKDSIYAILDVKLDSNSKDENDYTERKTWDLLLANGKHVESLNALGVKLAAEETKSVTLYYKVEENTTLKGAALEVNGSDRTRFEPLTIPLDAKTEFESQVKLPELMGELFEADGDDGFSFEIVNALYGVNLESSGRRADKDQRLVELTVRVGNAGDSSVTFNSSDDAVRLAVDGSKISPEQFDSKTLGSGEYQNFTLIYSIKENLSAFDLVVDLGDEIREASVDLPGDTKDGDEVTDDDSNDEDFISDDDSSDDEDFSDDDSSDDEDFSDDDSSDDEDFSDDDSSDDEDFDSEE